MMPVLLEPDDLLRMPDGDFYELIDGVPTEKPMGANADKIALRLASRLEVFCSQTRCGIAFAETSYRGCFPGKPLQLRKPDASFIATGRFSDDKVPAGDITIAPDMIAEVVSPNDGYEEVQSRIADFRSAKTPLIWVISPIAKSVLIRRLDGSCDEIYEDGELSGEAVIPGFTCKVAELFV